MGYLLFLPFPLREQVTIVIQVLLLYRQHCHTNPSKSVLEITNFRRDYWIDPKPLLGLLICYEIAQRGVKVFQKMQK